MYCRHCGEKINDNQAICEKCGEPVGDGDTKNVHGDEVSPQMKKTKLKFAVGFTVISVLTIILLFIPGYFHSTNAFGERVLWSFNNKADIFYPMQRNIIILLLLANPIMSFVGLKRNKNFSLIKIIISVVPFILLIFITLALSRNVSVVFYITLIALLAYENLSLAEMFVLPKSNKSTQSNTKSEEKTEENTTAE